MPDSKMAFLNEFSGVRFLGTAIVGGVERLNADPKDHPVFPEYSLANRVDMICDVFEQAWRENRAPKIEEFLHDTNPQERSAVLGELIAVELEYRRNRQENVSADSYVQRFPEFADLIQDVFQECVNSQSTSHPVQSTWGLSEDDEGVLSSHALFFAMHSEFLEGHVNEQQFSAGEFLMRQGEPGASLMIIREGTVEISSEDTTGESRVVGHVGAGQVLGEMSLLTSHPRSANVMAVDQVRVLVIPADTFYELARQHPKLSVLLTNLVAERLGMPGRDALTDKVLDRYRIHRRLGRGGMGVVYEAEDTTSQHRVALKMMSHKLVYCDEALERFRREADIIESFQHQNIVRMFRRFTAFHTYFIAMEFCQGRTLQEVLVQQGPPSEQALRNILGQLASALVYAHERNVVHRDIKPGNIMVGTDGTVKLMDFGLAEPVVEGTAPSGRVCGTPRYMSPEQREGRTTGRQADYFAFGCLAYEMLTSKPLFSGNHLEELARDFSVWEPPDLASICPDLTGETCRQLQPALDKSEERRVNLESIATWANASG